MGHTTGLAVTQAARLGLQLACVFQLAVTLEDAASEPQRVWLPALYRVTRCHQRIRLSTHKKEEGRRKKKIKKEKKIKKKKKDR